MCKNMFDKEALKEIIRNDFDKDYNYDEIIKKIEGENMKIKISLWKLAFVSMCFVMIIGGIFFINYRIILDSSVDKESGLKLNINNLDEVGMTRFDADIKEISSNGVNIVWPKILKDGITIPKDLDQSNAAVIYTRKDKNSKYDILNCYVYNYFNRNDNDDKNIRIAFSDAYPPIRDYFFSEEVGKVSIIKDVELTIFKYNMIYFTEFCYKGYYFDIETRNISEQELSNLLVSIIK